MRTHRLLAGLATAGLVGALAPVATAAQTPATPMPDDTIEVGPSIEDRIAERLTDEQAEAFQELQDRAARDAAQQQAGPASDPGDRGSGRGSRDDSPGGNPGPEPVIDATADPLVGLEREWLALDITGATPESAANFGYYEKNYRLAAVGEHIEVWVAVDDNSSYESDTYVLPFDDPDDCRNTITYDGQTRVEITPEQINQLVADFDQNIYPLETAALATPPSRNGDAAQYDLYDDVVFGDRLSERPDGYFTTEGGGDRTVALIDNVRDENYYTSPDVEQLSYIAGFFSSFFNAAFDRNVMTIDAYDWLHRTGANPPDDPSTDPCQAAAARPFLYEGTFAHEWQHLLQSYVGGESTWVNEGLSDWVQTLTGYVDPSQQITDPEYDSHIQCFTGFLAEFTQYNQTPRETSGPENSLTWWEDQGGGEVLCDYGAAYTFMEYVYGQFGQAALQFLFSDPEAGLDSVDAMLDTQGDPRSAQEFLHDWAAMVALDGALDDNGGALQGGSANSYSAPTLHSFINWDENDAYDTPGAPPNGSDYVRLRDGSGAYLEGGDLSSLTFEGVAEYEVLESGTQWMVDEDPPGEAGDPAWFSGSGDDLDNQIVVPVSVPDGSPTLSFQSTWDIEIDYDFGVVQVSTDGGQSWTTLDDTTGHDTTDNVTEPRIASELPGLTGAQDWTTVEYDLGPYAGQEVLVGFRYLTDGGVANPGWWVDDVMVGDTLVSDGSSVEGYQNYDELAPTPVANWHVTLLGYDSEGGAAAVIRTHDVAGGEVLDLSAARLRPFRGLDVVSAIVTLDEPTETIQQYAGYALTVDGVLQPGGS